MARGAGTAWRHCGLAGRLALRRHAARPDQDRQRGHHHLARTDRTVAACLDRCSCTPRLPWALAGAHPSARLAGGAVWRPARTSVAGFGKGPRRHPDDARAAQPRPRLATKGDGRRSVLGARSMHAAAVAGGAQVSDGNSPNSTGSRPRIATGARSPSARRDRRSAHRRPAAGGDERRSGAGPADGHGLMPSTSWKAYCRGATRHVDGFAQLGHGDCRFGMCSAINCRAAPPRAAAWPP